MASEGRPKVVTVTPQLAKAWLESQNTRNRHISPTAVSRYANDMKEGRWQFTGDPIQFDTDGVLINGQHRLQAVVDSGTTQRFAVWENLDPQSQDYMDQGVIRKPGQQLQIHGFKNGTGLASIARVLSRWDSGVISHSRGNQSTGEVIEYVKSNLDMLEFGYEWGNRINRNIPIGRAAVGAFACQLYRMFTQNPDWTSKDYAIDFLSKVESGVGLEANDPILVFRNTCSKYRIQRIRRSDVRDLYNLVRTWNGCVAGETYGKLQAPPNGTITAKHLLMKHEVEE